MSIDTEFRSIVFSIFSLPIHECKTYNNDATYRLESVFIEEFMKYNDSWFGIMSTSALSGLREYYSKSESLIKSARKRALSKAGRQAKQTAKKNELTGDEEFAQWDMLTQEQEITYDMFFTNLFRYSAVVLITLVLEDHLNKLSWSLYKTKRHPNPPTEPRGDTIESYRKYIDGYQLSYDTSLWDFADDLRTIRNCIVHASGDVSRRDHEQKQKLKLIVQKNIGVHIGSRSTQYQLTPLYLDEDMLIIEPRYCESAIENVANLLKSLSKAAGLPLRFKI